MEINVWTPIVVCGWVELGKKKEKKIDRERKSESVLERE